MRGVLFLAFDELKLTKWKIVIPSGSTTYREKKNKSSSLMV